jgi:protein involved in polysaccharide export with SLBB domain
VGYHPVIHSRGFVSRQMVHLLRSALTVVLVFAATAMAQQPAGDPVTVNPDSNSRTRASVGASVPAASGDQYRIGPRDVLGIRVTAGKIVPELSLDSVEVNECGRIPLASVYQESQNDIQAAGKTRTQLAEELRTFYLKYKRNPQVVVTIKEYNSQPVAINGAIVKPGQFQMRRPVRLLELVQFYAGGPTDKSGGRVQLGRVPAFAGCSQSATGTSAGVIDGGVAPVFLNFKLDEVLAGVDQANPWLQPGDVITLPEAKEAYVIGNVPRIGPIPLKDDSITITRALAIAGGVLPDTQKDKVLIHRPDPKGGNASQELVVDYRAISKHEAPDVTILPNDIIEVQVAGGKRLLRTLIGSVVPSVGQLPVHVIP